MSESRATPRIWFSVAVETAPELADAIGSFLLDRGAPGLQTDDGAGSVIITGHFETAGVEHEVERFIDNTLEHFPGVGRPVVRCSSITETDWAESWKDHFPPLSIGARVFVRPPWVADVPTGRVGIELDPGMAFGTGHHGSTQGCLTALDAVVTPETAPRVLDLGTGSGVLAIAAIRLGARSAVAIDIDPEACEIAVINTQRNGVDAAVEVSTRLAADDTGFDIIVANIFSGMLIGFANDIARRLKPGGIAIGSGLETAEATGVTDAWREAGMTSVREYDIDGWTTLVFRAPDASAAVSSPLRK